MSMFSNAGFPDNILKAIKDRLTAVETKANKNEEDIEDLQGFEDVIGGVSTTTLSIPSASVGAQSTKVTNKVGTKTAEEGQVYIPINAFLSQKTSGPSSTNIVVNEINNVGQNTVTVQFVQTNNAGDTQVAPGGTATIHWLRIK